MVAIYSMIRRKGFITYAVLEIRIRNWSAVFLKTGYFYRLPNAVPLKMYGKFG